MNNLIFGGIQKDCVSHTMKNRKSPWNLVMDIIRSKSFFIVETASELVYHPNGEVNQEQSDRNFKMLIVHAESKKCLSSESTKDLSECNIDQVNQHFSCINWSLYADTDGFSGIISGGQKELVLRCEGTKSCLPKFISDTKKNGFTDLKWIVQSPVIETVISVCRFIPKSDASSIYRIDTLDGDRCQIPFYSRNGKTRFWSEIFGT